MTITPEESEAYNWAVVRGGTWDVPSVLRDAVRRHVANEMRLEFEADHVIRNEYGKIWCEACDYESVMVNAVIDPRHDYKTDAEWDKAAHERLGGKSDG